LDFGFRIWDLFLLLFAFGFFLFESLKKSDHRDGADDENQNHHRDDKKHFRPVFHTLDFNRITNATQRFTGGVKDCCKAPDFRPDFRSKKQILPETRKQCVFSLFVIIL
jgi:hypothetical protein